MHVEPCENRGDKTHLAKSDAGTVFHAVDFNPEELVCQTEIGDFVLFPQPGPKLDYSFGSVFWLLH